MPSQPTSDAAAPARTVGVIVGPTASGKSALALELAVRNPGIEIVSADSRQVYLGMDIGTAKPSAAERAVCPHHLIDVVTPDMLFSAGLFAERAASVIDDILARGGTPLVVGGSGFYIAALMQGLAAPTVDPEVLAELERRGADEGFDRLYRELEGVDPVAAAAHAPQNYIKTLRALCCWYQTGRPYSSYAAAGVAESPRFDPFYLGLAPPRAENYARIDRRAERMIEEGLIEEVEKLLAKGYTEGMPGLRTVGYAEVLRHLRGELDRAAMLALMQQSTRRFAKRQSTWSRRMEGVEWMEHPDVDRAMQWFGRLTERARAGG